MRYTLLAAAAPMLAMQTAANAGRSDPIAPTPLPGASTEALGHEFSFQIDNVNSWAGAGSPLNEPFSTWVVPGLEVVGIGWSLTVETYFGSWFSDLTLRFPGVDPDAWISMADGMDSSGTATISSGGPLFLADLGMQPFDVNPTGWIDLEFFETYVDRPDDPDAHILYGTMTLYAKGIIPSPGVLCVLGAGLAGLGRRRR